MKPQIQYTKSGEINIAYQVFGTGNIDIVYIPGWVSNIDWMWANQELVTFFTELSKVARVVLFDKRGTGLSDRVVEFSTLEERMDDITAVMDAIGSKKAVLFGHSEGGSVSALFSATYPNRVISLIAFGIFAKRRYSDEYPWAPTDKERQKVYDMIENNWGGGEMNLESLVPSKAKDKIFMNWLASYFRSGASPTAALKLTKMNTQVDIIDILKYIKVPTLLMQRTNDIDVKIQEGRFIAERIQNSKLVEFKGSDHLFWVGNTTEVLNEIKYFIKDIKPKKENVKGLNTILFGKIKSKLSKNIKKEITHTLANKYSGKILNDDENNFSASFKTPGKAISFGQELGSIIIKNGTISLGVYFKESFDNQTEILEERDIYIINTINSQINKNEILVSQSIKYLLTGSHFLFKESTSMLAYKSTKLSKLYSISFDAKEEVKDTNSQKLSQYNSFLEDVINVVSKHYSNSNFSIETLTKEAGIGERQLQRKLKELTGKSPTQFITSYRLKKAKEALSMRNYTIAEIAFKFGFSSPSYFSKCFKKEFGISPNQAKLK